MPFQSSVARFGLGGGAAKVVVQSLSLANAGSTDAFVTKYDTTGDIQWAARIAGTTADYGLEIASDSSGNVYVSGFYSSSPVTIFNASGTSFGTLTNAASRDVFIVKYNTTGTVEWTARVASIGDDFPGGICTDTSRNVYVIGLSGETVTFFNANGTAFGTTKPVGLFW